MTEAGSGRVTTDVGDDDGDGIRRTLRLLIVDDEPDVLHVLHALLDSHDVVTVSSGERALETLENDDGFDAVLCDVMMAPVSGKDLYEAVEARDPDLASRFVFMTGGAVTREARRFIESVPRQTMHKPVQLRELSNVLYETAQAARRRIERAG